jgi:hypothetical protein
MLGLGILRHLLTRGSRPFLRSIQDEAATGLEPPLAFLNHSETPDPSPRTVQNGNREPSMQPVSNPLSQDQLLNEVREIYAGLTMVEKKIVELDPQQTQTNPKDLSNSQWEALIALHRTLLYEHHDFFLASRLSPKLLAMRSISSKLEIPARMWRYGIHSFLEFLRDKLPASVESMLYFIYLAYSIMTLLLESDQGSRRTWIECLGDLAKYRMAMEDSKMIDQDDWGEVSRYWDTHSAEQCQGIGMIRHYFALAYQQLRPLTSLPKNPESEYQGRLFSSGVSSKPSKSYSQARDTTVGTQQPKPKESFSHGRDVRFEIPCQLESHSASALGDYAAKRNFMKEEYATKLGFSINRNVVRKVTVGSGKEVITVGTASVPFRFKGEHDVHNLIFHLLPNCIHNIILGKPFLKLTKTFSNFANFSRRVKENIAKNISQAHVLYLGASTPMFEGSVNGQVQTALADSGSRVLIMDGAYARSIGVQIRTGVEHRTRLKFADNSAAITIGMAYNVEWCFGRDSEFGPPYKLDFHILENAPANVILNDTFLFDTKAFSHYHHCLTDDDNDDDDDDYDYDYNNQEMTLSFFAIDVENGRKQAQSMIFTAFRLAFSF